MLTLFYLSFTILLYLLAKRMYRRTGSLLCSPLLFCPVAIVAILLFFGVPYEAYDQGGAWLTLMLKPATVALAVPMYKYRATIRKHLAEILVSVTGGAVVAIVTSIAVANFFGVDAQFMASLAPRSVTTPIAMGISEVLGGNPSITAVFVICTGVTGTLFISLLLRYLPAATSPVTKGMLLGVTAHGTGTARAYEFGQVEGVIASLAMIFMGLVSTVIARQLVDACLQVIRG